MSGTRIHPLHTDGFLIEHINQYGTYPGNRRTGKTTAAILAAIAESIRNPFKAVEIADPDLEGGTYELRKWTAYLANDIIRILDLKFMWAELANISVSFKGTHQGVVIRFDDRKRLTTKGHPSEPEAK